ncbi:MAG: hypothetical protein IPL78_09180 [Chloroflexi bacterium]|nr:hypothetical protein [Chloroflexota bacterium]
MSAPIIVTTLTIGLIRIIASRPAATLRLKVIDYHGEPFTGVVHLKQLRQRGAVKMTLLSIMGD